ncbi:MAG: glutathione S-transferase C-terminal domain-containing protein, partial [Massilia sp.]
ASSVLNTIGGFYNASDMPAYEASANTLRQRFGQLEDALGAGPYFGGRNFSLVDAAFGPVFRYFDVFDSASGVALFDATPKLRAWRQALGERPSVQEAVAPDYPQRLAQFVIRRGGVLGSRLASQA